MPTFALTTFEKHKVDSTAEQLTDTTYFRATYPLFEDQELQQWVEHLLLGTDSLTLEEAAARFLDEHRELYLDTTLPIRPWMEEYDLAFTRQQDQYWALTRSYYGYTGGAHGIYYTQYLHVDPQQKRLLPIDSLLDMKAFASLTALAEKSFRQQEGISDKASLEEEYFFEEGQFYLPTNFALEKDSIAFLYGLYEIKPYAAGETILRLAYKDVQSYLKPLAKQIIETKPIKQDH